MVGRCRRAGPAQQLPGQGHVDLLAAGGEGPVSPPTSQPITGPRPSVTHHIDRHVVHRAAVDQHLALMKDRRQDPGNRDRGAQPAPQRAAAMHHRLAGGEVG